ncbi:MAG: hemolysin family protein [Alphaproteobacteria bacterium]
MSDADNGRPGGVPEPGRGLGGPAWFARPRAFLRRLRRGRNGDSLRESLEELIEEHEETDEAVDSHEWVLLRNILELRDLSVDDILVPRTDIVAVAEDASLADIIRVMSEKPHSRIPVYRGDLDDVIGMVHIKDVLAVGGADKRFRLARILRDILFVAPSMRVLDLLQRMRETRIHMALVVDEYGGIDGLLTIEDLVEEIVGEIVDEHDVEPPRLFEEPGGGLVGFARAEIAEIGDRLGSELTELARAEDIDTLGGLVVSIAGRVPSRGEVIRHESGVEFEILDADPRRVRRLRIRPISRGPMSRDKDAPADKDAAPAPREADA